MTTYWIAAPFQKREPFDLHLPPPPEGWARVPSSRLHLTLCYLGEVSADEATRAEELALEIVGHEGFSVRASGASFFGEKKDVLALTLDKAVRRAMVRVRRVVRPFATDLLDRWPPSPHMTFALRVRGEARARDVHAYARVVSASVRDIPLAFGPFSLQKKP